MSGSAEARILAEQLNRIPKELRKELRPALRAAAEPIRQDAARRASWSTRIPRSLRIGTSFAGARASGVFIRADASVAPHARVFENAAGRGVNFRHPVFGNRDVWVAQASRPFLFPAARAGRDKVMDAITEAVETAAERGGFR